MENSLKIEPADAADNTIPTFSYVLDAEDSDDSPPGSQFSPYEVPASFSQFSSFNSGGVSTKANHAIAAGAESSSTPQPSPPVRDSMPCRACARAKPRSKLRDIVTSKVRLDGRVEIFSLQKLFEIGTGMFVMASDPLSRFICYPCTERLRLAVTFRFDAIEAKERLTAALGAQQNAAAVAAAAAAAAATTATPQTFQHIPSQVLDDSDSDAYDEDASEAEEEGVEMGADVDADELFEFSMEEENSETAGMQNNHHLLFGGTTVSQQSGGGGGGGGGGGNGNGGRSSYINIKREEDADRPYRCQENFCNAVFKSLYALKDHQVVHSGDKPFKCEFCSANFKYRSARSIHTRQVHTKANLQQCPHCDSQFLNPGRLKRHISAVHNIQIL